MGILDRPRAIFGSPKSLKAPSKAAAIRETEVVGAGIQSSGNIKVVGPCYIYD